MKAVLMIVELFRHISISYGQMFLMIGTVLGKGGRALENTWETLSQEKYKPIQAHFQAGILHLIAALAEFKKGGKALKGAVMDNPEDFKDMTDFILDIKVHVPKSVEAAFSDTDAFHDAMKESFTARLPEFIRTSGEYMEAINANKIECDETTFRAQLREGLKGNALLRAATKAKQHIFETGWADVKVKQDAGDDITLVFWADDFDISEFVPANYKEIPKEKFKEDSIAHVKIGNVYYEVDLLKDEDHASVMKKFDETFGMSSK